MRGTSEAALQRELLEVRDALRRAEERGARAVKAKAAYKDQVSGRKRPSMRQRTSVCQVAWQTVREGEGHAFPPHLLNPLLGPWHMGTR
jgi:hypothetical protein